MPDSPEPDAMAGPPRFSRRRLLIGTSLAAVGAGAASVAGFAWLTQGPRIDLDALGAGPLSVGFVEGSGDRVGPSRERGAGGPVGAGAENAGPMTAGSPAPA